MNTTIFLAQLWGPAILAVGLGVFISRKYYVRIYRDLERDPLAVLVFGMVAAVGGVAHVLAHNLWGNIPQVVVSILGWGLLIKGLLFIIAPALVDRAGNAWANKNLIPVAGTLSLIVGVYLCWIGYFI